MAPAKTLQQKYDATQGKLLPRPRQRKARWSNRSPNRNRLVDSMLGEVSDLRQEQLAIEGELATKQDELDARDPRSLEADKKHLAEGPSPPAESPRRAPAIGSSRFTSQAAPT